MVEVFRTADVQLGLPPHPHLSDDAGGYHHREPHGTHLLVRLHARRKGFPALLRFPFALHHVYVRPGCGHEHFPDVPILGACGRIVLSSYWLLLSRRGCRCRIEEGVHRNPLCRLILPYRHFDLQLLRRNVQLRPQCHAFAPRAGGRCSGNDAHRPVLHVHRRCR